MPEYKNPMPASTKTVTSGGSDPYKSAANDTAAKNNETAAMSSAGTGKTGGGKRRSRRSRRVRKSRRTKTRRYRRRR